MDEGDHLQEIEVPSDPDIGAAAMDEDQAKSDAPAPPATAPDLDQGPVAKPKKKAKGRKGTNDKKKTAAAGEKRNAAHDLEADIAAA